MDAEKNDEVSNGRETMESKFLLPHSRIGRDEVRAVVLLLPRWQR